jgi:hypothetical protein
MVLREDFIAVIITQLTEELYLHESPQSEQPLRQYACHL